LETLKNSFSTDNLADPACTEAKEFRSALVSLVNFHKTWPEKSNFDSWLDHCLGWRQDNGNKSNQESKVDFLATCQCLVKIDKGQQKIKIICANLQSNLRAFCQPIFSLCRHHPSHCPGLKVRIAIGQKRQHLIFHWTGKYFFYLCTVTTVILPAISIFLPLCLGATLALHPNK